MGLPAPPPPMHRSLPESGSGEGTVKIDQEGVRLPCPALSLGSRIRKIKKPHIAHTFFPNYCFLRDPKVSF